MRHGFGTFRDHHVSMRDDFGTFRKHQRACGEVSETSETIMQACDTFPGVPKISCKHARRFLDSGKCHASMRDGFSALENIMHACATVSELRNILMKNRMTEFFNLHSQIIWYNKFEL